MEINIEIEYVIKTLIFVIAGIVGIWFVYTESKEYEAEEIEHKKELEEFNKWKGAN